MRAYLRKIRAYVYTGTQPASYTLGLIEAMMTGVPVVSIGPESMWVPDLFEGHEIVGRLAATPRYSAAQTLAYLLADRPMARTSRARERQRRSTCSTSPHRAPVAGVPRRRTCR
jgi:glycosyltransferase involved in cell wall biosynthesis